MPKHIRRLLLLLGITALAAIAAKEIFTAPSFGDFGHYRADSVPEIASQTALFQGSGYCQECHTQRVAFWKKGKHQTVTCEICHTAAAGHPVKKSLPIPTRTIELCSSCHEAMPARPTSSIKQVVIAEHMGDQACIECHNPHSPRHFTWEELQGLANQLRVSQGQPHG